VARALGSNLDDEADILIWSDHIFAANQYSLDSLLRSLDTIDYAILIITLDDLISQRLKSKRPAQPRGRHAFSRQRQAG
jgi:predicted nucleotide-binding protein